MKVAILRIEGTNCEEELYLSFKRLGLEADIIHLNQISRKEISIFDYGCIMIPGGFSSGDYVRAGAIFATRLKATLKDELLDFIREGRLLGGICNGFQVLVEMGLLPGFTTDKHYPVAQAALTTNDSGRFECRPTFLKHETTICRFTKKLEKGKIISLPVAHMEGKFVFPTEKEKNYLFKLIENEQIVFRYVDRNGNYESYPWNPNGSLYNIAGICNKEGNIFGMMPHPERVFYKLQHPDWTRSGLQENIGDGRIIFESIAEELRK